MVDDIYLINNLFTPEFRNNLIEELKPLLLDGSTLATFYNFKTSFPGRQTHNTLHLHPNFKEVLESITELVTSILRKDVKISTMWGLWVDGKKDHMNWHNHSPNDYSIVYYLKVPPFIRNGTVFEDRGLVRTDENSLLIFPSNLNHTSPSYFWKGDRYVISADYVV